MAVTFLKTCVPKKLADLTNSASKYAKLWKQQKITFFGRSAVDHQKTSFFFYFLESPLKWIILLCLDIRIPGIQEFTDLDPNVQICKKKKKKKKKKKVTFFDRSVEIEKFNFFFFDFLETLSKWKISSCLDIRIPEIQNVTDFAAKYTNFLNQQNWHIVKGRRLAKNNIFRQVRGNRKLHFFFFSFFFFFFFFFWFSAKPFKMKNYIMSWYQDTWNPRIH